MTSENPSLRVSLCPGTTSENTAEALADYQRALRAAPLAAETRRTYYSKVRGYLTSLAAADVDGDPLTQPPPRDRAVRDYPTHLVTAAKRAPRTNHTAPAAIHRL